MKKTIENTLIEMGFNPAVKGFTYIVNTVDVIFKNNCEAMKVSEIFELASGDEEFKYNTYGRNIRNAIELAYVNDAELYRQVFDGQLPKLKSALYRIAYLIKNNEGGENHGA